MLISKAVMHIISLLALLSTIAIDKSFSSASFTIFVLFSFDSGIRVFPENAEYPFPDGTVYLHYERSHYSVLVPIYSDIDVHDIETLCQFKTISTDWA